MASIGSMVTPTGVLVWEEHSLVIKRGHPLLGPGAFVEVFSLGDNIAGRGPIGSTSLPFHLFDIGDDDGFVRYLAQPSNGEAYTFIERSRGDVWFGAYANGTGQQIGRIQGGEIVQYLTHASLIPAWRPKGVATDGTRVWFGGNNGSALGVIVSVGEDESVSYDSGVFTQVPVCLDFHDDTLYAAGSGEGLEGASTGPAFYALDASSLSVQWSAPLAGSRPLGMIRVDPIRYLVACHLSSDTVMRLVMINTQSQAREWNVIVSGVRCFGRARNVLRRWAGRLWHQADDGLYEVIPGQRSMILRFPVPAEVQGYPSGLAVHGNKIFGAWKGAVFRGSIRAR